MTDRATNLGRIQSAAARVELRLRLERGLRVLPHALTLALAVTAATLAIRKVLPGSLSNRHAWEIVIGAGAAALLAVLVAVLRRLAPQAGAVTLDRHHDLAGRITNALAFQATSPGDRTPLMEVAIDDACDHAKDLDPRRAAPLSVPRDLLGSALVAAGVAAVAMLRLPPPPPPFQPLTKQIDAVQMSPDDVELFRDAARALDKRDASPEVKTAVESFNKLIEDIANKRIDRAEAFRRMEQIERDLQSGMEADAKAFQDALKQTSDELKKSDLAKPLAESLEKKNLDQAKKDLKNLAATLREDKANAKTGKKGKADKAALDRLKAALEKASAKRKEALAAINEKRNELREQLLNKKQDHKDPDAGAPNPEDERLLKKKERELERLDREAERQERMQRQLDRLDRELGKAAEDLMKDLGMSAEDLEQAAEDINRMQQEEMTEKQKEELRQRLEELREMLRQQGQGGKERMKRMLKFGKRARGGGSPGKGQKGKDGEPEPGDDGEDGDGKEGQGQGEGKDGEGKDGQGGKGMTLKLTRGSGPGGIPIPGGGSPGGPGDGPPGAPGSGQGPDGPGGGPGKGIGTSHDPNVMGKSTDMKSGTSDVQEQGLDTKQGPTNSEVILGAAQRGFKGSGYKKVFTDYHTRAEDQINKDQIPDGYRFYVNRYFQLIRPRE